MIFDENTAPSEVDHPKHYNSHPSGVECITVTEWFGFNLGNAIKYIWRAGQKTDLVTDLEKARWYIDREIQRVKADRQKGKISLDVEKSTHTVGERKST